VSQGIKVLVLGKRVQGLCYLRRRLDQLGCDCMFATSTEEAIALMDRHNFHLILCTRPLHEVAAFHAPRSEMSGSTDLSPV
jgi:CheY-like chemotaxis protein